MKKKELEAYKEGGPDAAKVYAEKAKVLEDKYPGALDKFANTKTSGGANYNGMSTRLEIVKAHCFN
jgi:hypothetical protein